MIPRDFITEWRAHAPWVSDRQVEQDLALSRAIVELFSSPVLTRSVAFRGGTALYKLHLRPAARYSEDIDLVQTDAEPIGATLDAIHEVLDPWLGVPRWKQSEGRVTIVYRFDSEETPPSPLRLKVEISSREHFNVLGLRRQRFEVMSRWFRGAADVRTYELDELLGTKVRALYQRRKGRDLFDIALALKEGGASAERVVHCFLAYMREGGTPVSRAMFERNLALKRGDGLFTADLAPLLAGDRSWSFEDGFDAVLKEIGERLPGEPWKGTH